MDEDGKPVENPDGKKSGKIRQNFIRSGTFLLLVGCGAGAYLVPAPSPSAPSIALNSIIVFRLEFGMGTFVAATFIGLLVVTGLVDGELPEAMRFGSFSMSRKMAAQGSTGFEELRGDVNKVTTAVQKMGIETLTPLIGEVASLKEQVQRLKRKTDTQAEPDVSLDRDEC